MTPWGPLWGSPPPHWSLGAGNVHVWSASLDQPAARVARLARLLSVDERARAARFHFERDRTRFTVGRGLLRVILGRYLAVDPARLTFRYGSRGKPSLDGTLSGYDLRFNLAHSQGMALYALAACREIGVDVECIRPVLDAEQIAERFFSAREAAAFRALPPGLRSEAFFSCWTRKEAYLKATGDGLARPLDTFDVSLLPGEPARLQRVAGDRVEASRWSLEALAPAVSCVGALAVEGRFGRLACWAWT